MRLGGRILAAAEALDEIRGRGRPASEALRDWAASHRFAGSSDRAAIGDLVYDSLRRMASQCWRMQSEDSCDLAFATVLDQWGASREALESALADDRFAPPPPSEARWGSWESRKLAEAPDEIRADIPASCAEEFRRAFGARWLEEASALRFRAPLDLRVNALKATPEKALRQLARLGAEPLPNCPGGLRIHRDSASPSAPASASGSSGEVASGASVEDAGAVRSGGHIAFGSCGPAPHADSALGVDEDASVSGGEGIPSGASASALASAPRRAPNLRAEPAWRKGWVEIQDEGSQLAAILAGASPGEQVMDFCAGAGGKTLAMASHMGNKGQIHAWDRDRNRLAAIFERLARAGTRNVQACSSGEGLDALRGRMDLVLVDAPCSGSGAWRRRPDAKWRFDSRRLEARVAEQAEILPQAARFVRPGGRLAYVTCSLFAAENEDRVDAFLEAEPEFSLAEAPGEWDFLARRARWPRPSRAMILLSPLRSGTDGFFVALMRRRDAP